MSSGGPGARAPAPGAARATGRSGSDAPPTRATPILERKLRRPKRRASPRVAPSHQRSRIRMRASPSRLLRRRSRRREIILDRADAALARLEEALDVLARVDDALGAQHAAL